MKKILSTLILLSLLSLPMMVAVETSAHQPKPPGPPPPVVTDIINPIDVFKRIVDWVFYILLIFAALMIIVAAFYFITAAGDAEKTQTARNFVLYAIIGVLVGFLAKGLVWLVGSIVGQEVVW